MTGMIENGWVEHLEDERTIGKYCQSVYGWEIAFAGGRDVLSSKGEAVEALQRAQRCNDKGVDAFRRGVEECPYGAGSMESTAWWCGYEAAKRAFGIGSATVSMWH